MAETGILRTTQPGINSSVAFISSSFKFGGDLEYQGHINSFIVCVKFRWSLYDAEILPKLVNYFCLITCDTQLLYPLRDQ